MGLDFTPAPVSNVTQISQIPLIFSYVTQISQITQKF